MSDTDRKGDRNPYTPDKPYRQQMQEELAEMIDCDGRPPDRSEFDQEGDFSSKQLIAEFGSWEEAVDAAGGNPDLIYLVYTDEDLKAELQRVADSLGHTPTMADFDEMSDISSVTFVSRFGSWREAVRAAGLSVRTHGVSDEQLLAEIRRLADGDTPPLRSEMRKEGEVFVDDL